MPPMARKLTTITRDMTVKYLEKMLLNMLRIMSFLTPAGLEESVSLRRRP